MTSPICDSTPWILRMFRRTSTCGSPVVDDSCSTYSCGVCVTPSTGSSGSVAVMNSSAALAAIAISSRAGIAASSARASSCRSRSRRISPVLAWLTCTNGCRVR